MKTEAINRLIEEDVSKNVFAQRMSGASLEARRELAALETAIAEKDEECQVLRELLAIRVAGADLYADDGELQDSSSTPHIDFKRDSAEEIRTKLTHRGCDAAISSEPAGKVLVDLDKLREIEWGESYKGQAFCPCCHAQQYPDCKHESDCWLGNMLKESE